MSSEQSNVEQANHEQHVWVIITYVLHLVGAILALPSIVGLVMNYVLRDGVSPELRSHHDWMIRSFWWALLWVILGGILYIVVVGWVILVIAWLWYVYRHIRGLVNLADHHSMPY